MKNQISYIWASDYSENSGEGILGRLFIEKLIFENKKLAEKIIYLNKGSKNKKTFFHKYIDPLKGALLLRSYKENNIIFLNYLPLWNFLIFLLLPKKTVLGPITGGVYKGKVKNFSGIVRKYLFPIFYKISTLIIFSKFSNITFSTSILKKYISKQKQKKICFNFVFQNFNTSKSTHIPKTHFDIAIYNRNHSTKKNKNFYDLIQKLYKTNLKILIFGDRFKFQQTKNFIYKDYVKRKLLLDYLKKTKFVINNLENYYSLFAIDSYNSKCIVISDYETYKNKSQSKNFLNTNFKDLNFQIFKRKKFNKNDKKFINYLKKYIKKTNLILRKIK